RFAVGKLSRHLAVEQKLRRCIEHLVSAPAALGCLEIADDQRVFSLHDEINASQQLRAIGQQVPTQLFLDADDRSLWTGEAALAKRLQHAIGEVTKIVEAIAGSEPDDVPFRL